MAVHSTAAAPQPVNLVYRAPPECPGEREVVERATAQVQHSSAGPVMATASIVKRGERYHMELAVDGGTQRIEATSCGELVETLTVILSLAAEPRVRVAPTGSQGSPQAASDVGPPAQGEPPRAQLPSANDPPPPQHERQTAVVTPHRPRKSTDQRSSSAAGQSELEAHRPMVERATENAVTGQTAKFELHPTLLLWTEYGMLPRIAHGPNLGLWIDRGDYSLVVTAEWLVPQFAQMSGGTQPRGGYVSFLGGQVGLCRRLLRPRRLSGCLGVEGGDMMGKGTGLFTTRLGHGIWLSGNAEFATRVPIGDWLAADMRLGFAVPIKRPAFGFDGFNWRFEPRAWSIRVATGISWF